MQFIKSRQLYNKALNYFPGGVNSPVRAFKSVAGTPVFIKKGNGSKISDEDNNEYIDYCCSWGPLILGHNHPSIRKKLQEVLQLGTTFGTSTRLENELAELILKNNPYIEKIRFVNSGTEATMSAIRLARAHTKKDKIIKFEGCYHGHADYLLVKAGSGLATFGIASSAGINSKSARDTIVLPLNNKEAVVKAFKKFKNTIACIIIEPVPANNGLLLQNKSFLQFLKDICRKNKSLLIFDEVISGFRIGITGAAGFYKIKPDIITYGKIIGGGLPVGAYGASKEIMSKVAPDGDVYQAGTLSGNPLAMAAGIAQIKELLKQDFYVKLNRKTQEFTEELNNHFRLNNYPAKVFSIASIFWLTFTDKTKIQSASEINNESSELYKTFHQKLLQRGIYFAPSAYEVGFVSSAHSEKDLARTKNNICKTADEIF